MGCARKIGRAVCFGLFVLALAAGAARAEWHFVYEDDFSTHKAEADSYDHSLFWPELAFPPGEPYLFYTSFVHPPGGLAFADSQGSAAHLGYVFPLLPGGPADVQGLMELDLFDRGGGSMSYSISGDGVLWTVPTVMPFGHQAIPLGSSQGTCYVMLSGQGAVIDNLRAVVVPGPATTWTSGVGEWHDGGNWHNGVPAGGVGAYVDNGGTAQIGSDAEAGGLYVGTIGAGTVDWIGGALSADRVEVGAGGRLNVHQHWTCEAAVAQNGGTVSVSGQRLLVAGAGSYRLSDGTLEVAHPSAEGLVVDGNASFEQSGGEVHIEGSLSVGQWGVGEATCTVSDGLLTVSRAAHPMGFSGMVSVGGTGGGSAGVIGTMEVMAGAEVRAATLWVAGPGFSGGQGTLRMSGGQLRLDTAGAMEEGVIAGTVEGHGTITCPMPFATYPGALLRATGGELTFDAELGGPLTIEVDSNASLRARGTVAGAVTNAGGLWAHHGKLVLTGETVTNSGTLGNRPGASLFVSPAALVHTGDVVAHGGGAVEFAQPITNHAGRQILLQGGVLSAPSITNAPGGTMTGAGVVTADLTNRGEADFYGQVQVFGDVSNEPNAVLGVRNGDLLIAGHTTNAGRVKVTNGQAYFEGGLTNSGTVDVDPARAVVVGDLRLLDGGRLLADAGSTLQLMADFINESTRPADVSLEEAAVDLHAPGRQSFEAAGADVGSDPGGWADNFAVGTFVVRAGAKAVLADAFDNRLDGADDEAVYVDTLVIEPGGGIELGGVALYYLNGGGPKRLIYGDTDLSGRTDALDYLALKTAFGTAAGASWFDSDTDGDGDVDYDDYVRARDGFASSLATPGLRPAGGQLTPEPCTLVLVALGALVAVRPGRRRTRPTAWPPTARP